MFGYPDETLSLMFDILHQNIAFINIYMLGTMVKKLDMLSYMFLGRHYLACHAMLGKKYCMTTKITTALQTS